MILCSASTRCSKANLYRIIQAVLITVDMELRRKHECIDLDGIVAFYVRSFLMTNRVHRRLCERSRLAGQSDSA